MRTVFALVVVVAVFTLVPLAYGRDCGDIFLNSTAGLSDCTSATSVAIGENCYLSAISLPNLTAVRGDVLLEGTSKLGLWVIQMRALLKVDGTLRIANMPRTVSVELGALVSATSVEIVANPELDGLLLGKLENVEQSLYLKGNTALGKTGKLVELGPVSSKVQDVQIEILTAALTHLSLQVTEALSISFAGVIATIDLAQLTTVGTLRLDNVGYLKTFSLPVVTSMDGIQITRNPNLLTVDLPALTSIAKSIDISNNSEGPDVNFSVLECVPKTKHITLNSAHVSSCQKTLMEYFHASCSTGKPVTCPHADE